MKPTITTVEIGPMPRPMPEGMFDDMPSVKATFDNGETKKLFEFYPDELSFSESEFIGLTERQAVDLKQQKDKQFLQS